MQGERTYFCSRLELVFANFLLSSGDSSGCRRLEGNLRRRLGRIPCVGFISSTPTSLCRSERTKPLSTQSLSSSDSPCFQEHHESSRKTSLGITPLRRQNFLARQQNQIPEHRARAGVTGNANKSTSPKV